MFEGVILAGAAIDDIYPFYLSGLSEFSERINLKRSEITHNLPRLERRKTYIVLDCKVKLSKQGELGISTKLGCKLLGLKIPFGRGFKIEHVYLKLEERMVPNDYTKRKIYS
jgi:hypothetical protein